MKTLTVVGTAVAAGLAVPALIGAGVLTSPNPIIATAQRDETFSLATDDARMRAAFGKGRATLNQFLSLAEKHPSSADNFAVKIPVKDANSLEYIWVTNFKWGGSVFNGIVNSTPRSVSNVREGQLISFDRADIVDWMYEQDGRIKGNFTACVLIADHPARQREEFMRKYGLDCSA